MADLFCHVRSPRLASLTGRLIGPFAWLERRVPAVRRHGYLIACVAEKPAVTASAPRAGRHMRERASV
ncbi:MAG: hypothetical protein H0T39_15495 [Actinobacteria bacterium]|nr:hypothetical protein [Actinomycetota bacterium]